MSGETRTLLKRGAIEGGAIAAGGVTVWTLADKLSFEQLMAMIERIGFPAAFLFVVIVLGNRWMGQFVNVQRDQVREMGRLASSVETIAAKDDARAREQDILLDHLAQNSDAILKKVEAIEKEVLS